MTNGRQSSLTAWYYYLRAPLRRFLTRRGAAHADAEDIAQEVFLRLLRADRTELVRYPQAYLQKIALGVMGEWALSASRAKPHSDEWLPELVDALGPDALFEESDAEAQLRQVLQALPARQREIVTRRFGLGMTNEQIAAQLGLTRRIVKRDMERAYALLRGSLDPELLEVAWARLGEKGPL